MKNINPKAFAFFLFGLFGLCFAAFSLANGTKVTDIESALKIAYKTIPVIVSIWLGFVGYAWKWRIFRGWLVPFPNLEGTWQGVIESTWKDETGYTPAPIPTILTIKQSFGRISCVMRTAEMSSRSYLADFWIDPHEQIRKLGYAYSSSPSIVVAERSQPHDGTMIFELLGDPVAKLNGIYWTTRKTTGEVKLTFRCKQRLDEFPRDLGDHPVKGKAAFSPKSSTL